MDKASLYALYQQYPLVSTDTRKIKPGSIFFALKGDQFDGNAFASMALRQGAAYAVVSDPDLKAPGMICVEDTLAALQSLARFHRQQLNIPVIGITGSNGKTTTKELITSVLSAQYKVHATAGNLNNHIGVPLTLLDASPDTDIIVCEMGANHPGEIAFLCSLAEPTHGLITNIGKAHLEGFGSIEGVQRAKGELFTYLQEHHGLCFVNTDDPRLRELGMNITHKITFGFDAAYHPDVLFTYHVNTVGPGFTLISQDKEVVTIRSAMFGHYNASNMLAAYTVGRHFAIPTPLIIERLTAFVPGANRSEIIEHNGTTVVKDAYNANPSSMELAIKAFSDRFPTGWLVLGDMKEVGESSREAHQHIIDLVHTLRFDRIYLVGPDFRDALDVRQETDARLLHADTIEGLKAKWDWNACRGTAVLLKGSRSMHLEKLLENG